MSGFGTIKDKAKNYWKLTKSLQTGLLLVTGFTGYISGRPEDFSANMLGGLLLSLFLTVAGSTVLNMVYDRDIDSKMNRTRRRPLPSGSVSPAEALFFGVFISLSGLALAFYMSVIYGLVVFAGFFLDAVVYTIWLKRYTAWSIVWGGISGGMPILAGRVLAMGQIDLIGILLSISILLWIPTHILTFSMLYYEDYKRAGIPTFPSTYGYRKTRLIIAFSSLGAAFSIALGIYSLGLAGGYLWIFGLLTVGLLGVAMTSIYRPSEKINFTLFKYASIYMLSSMILVALGV